MLAAYPHRAAWKPETVDNEACKLEARHEVLTRLDALKREAAERSVISRAEVLNGMARAFSKADSAVAAWDEADLPPTASATVRTLGPALLDALPADAPSDGAGRTWDFGLMLAPPHLAVHRAVAADEGGEWWMLGGRVSAKSSAVSLEVVGGLMRHPERSAVVFLKVGKFLREGPYEQVLWAMEEMGVAGEWECTVSPLQMTRRATGQVVKFRGCDDAGKTKAVKAPAGTYYAYQWFEEVDQFGGMAEVRKICQSYTRGPAGAPFFRFYTFNPPRSASSWVNRQVAERESRGLPVFRSSYLEVPPEWVPEQLREDAEELRRTDEQSWRHEYLGEPVGTGTQVFDRVEFREVTDAEIASFDNPRVGQDFGWWPDPWAVTLSEWRPATRTLVTWREDRANKLTPPEQAERVRALLTWDDGDGEPRYHHLPVPSDDADPQSIASQRDCGVNARAAGKGNMRRASYRWLQSVRWVIDPARCPNLAREVRELSYEVTRDGEVLDRVPDGNDHCVDATRYAVMREVARARSAYRGATQG